MLQRFLFIGVGGSGGRTLTVLRQQLEQRLNAAGWPNGFPRGWQFLHIDVPTEADTADPALPPPLPPDQYCGLVGEDIRYLVIDGSLISGSRDKRELLESVVAWRPDPAKAKDIEIQKGAGQYRAVGRVVAATHLGSIKQHVDRVVARLDDSVVPEMRELTKFFDPQDTATGAEEPRVMIVSSIAGGAGAGILMDICDLLRAHAEPWLDSSIGILFAPDVFKDLRPASRAGVHPNALATISELVAGYWDSDPFLRPPGETAFLERVGSPGDIERRGVRYPFLIGSSNGRITFGDQNEMYRAIGRTLAAFALSPSVQRKFDSYVRGNWVSSGNAKELLDKTELKPVGAPNPLSSLGFSRVTTGRDRFGEYAEERLARVAVQRLLRGHLEKYPEERPADAIRQASEDAWVADDSAFLRASGLRERNELLDGGKRTVAHDDVIEALRPGHVLTEKHPLVNRLQTGASRYIDTLGGYPDEVLAEITQGGKDARPAETWLSRIRDEYRGRRDGLIQSARNERSARTRDWVPAIQRHLLELTIRTAAKEGLPVTERLLRKLDEELDQVVSELANERVRLQDTSKSVLRQLQKKMIDYAETMRPNNPMLRQAVESTIEALEVDAEEEVRALAIELINDARSGLVRPLADAVKEAASALVAQERQIDERTKERVVEQWPAGDFIPARFGPAVNEFFIERSETFENLLGEQLERTVGADTRLVALEAALQEVLTAPLTRPGIGARESVPGLLSFARAWMPQKSEYRPSGAPAASQAELESACSLYSILARARAWVTRPEDENLLGRFIGESLRDYLDPKKARDGTEHNQRITQFRTAFEQAIDTSAPFASVSNATLQAVHDRPKTDFETQFTEIPFPEGTPGRQVVEDVMKQRGYHDEELRQLPFKEGSQSEIEMFTMLDYPYHPMVFSSLMEPIAGEWKAQRGAEHRTNFWQWRRARPLPEFVPVAPIVRREMVRGWFTARLLNQIDLKEGTACSVYDPEFASFLEFPYPYLGPDPYDQIGEVFPAILESLPLAFLSMSQSPMGGALTPYARLRTLGVQRPGDDSKDYEVVTPELRDWLLHGTVTGRDAPTPEPELAGTPDDSWEDRRKAIRGFAQDLLANYRSDFESVSISARADVWTKVPRSWELRHDIEGALNDLLGAIERLTPTSTGGRERSRLR